MLAIAGVIRTSYSLKNSATLRRTALHCALALNQSSAVMWRDSRYAASESGSTWSISIGFPVIPLNRCISQPVLSIQIVRSAASDATSLTCGDISSMACPRVCNSRATLSAAIATSEPILVIGEVVCSAQRKRFVGSLPVTANGISGPGIGQGSDGGLNRNSHPTGAVDSTARSMPELPTGHTRFAKRVGRLERKFGDNFSTQVPPPPLH